MEEKGLGTVSWRNICRSTYKSTAFWFSGRWCSFCKQSQNKALQWSTIRWVNVFVLGIELKVTSAKLLLSLLLLAMFLLNLNFQVDLPQLHPSAIPETICRDVWT